MAYNAEDKEIELIKEELEAEREWRIMELMRTKLILRDILRCSDNKKGDNSSDATVFLRMTLPFLYAHWEGYCKTTFNYIREFIGKKELKTSEIKNSLLTFSLDHVYDRLKGKSGFSQKCDFTSLFINNLNNSVAMKNSINTKSNLNFEVLTGIFQIFGMDIEPIQIYKSDLDRLVVIRNSIAHGQNSYIITEEQFEKYSNFVTELIDTILISQYTYISNETYYV